MKKEFLILSFVVGCSAASCMSRMSTPAYDENDTGITCGEAIEVEADYDDALVQLEACENTAPDCTGMHSQEYVDSLLAEIETLKGERDNVISELNYSELRYDGLLEQFRDIQTNYGDVVFEYGEYKSICELHGVWLDVEVD